jgi:drug/metabolite transporter (DMT)-like permease
MPKVWLLETPVGFTKFDTKYINWKNSLKPPFYLAVYSRRRIFKLNMDIITAMVSYTYAIFEPTYYIHTYYILITYILTAMVSYTYAIFEPIYSMRCLGERINRRWQVTKSAGSVIIQWWSDLISWWIGKMMSCACQVGSVRHLVEIRASTHSLTSLQSVSKKTLVVC